MSATLEIAALRAGYSGGDILKGVNLQTHANEVVTIIGPNGCGKSTLLKTLAGLLSVRHGRICLDGKQLAGLSAPSRVRVGLSYVPQENNVFRSLTVGENLTLAKEYMPGKGPARDSSDLLDLFPELAGRWTAKAGNLSGGQRQMLAFACALAVRPKLLMLDEPSAGLSPKYTAELMNKVREVNRSGVAILMVEQNAIEALRISDRCVVMAGGQVRSVCAAAEVLDMPDLHSLYLGNVAEEK